MKLWLLIATLAFAGCARDESSSENTDDFQVRRDGFSFANYGRNRSVVNLTPETASQLCRIPCLRGRGESCVISAPLESFLDFANKQMDEGHCYGMAVLSRAIFANDIRLGELDPFAQTTYDLPLSLPVQKALAYYSAAQYANPSASSALRNLNPNEVLDLVRNAQSDAYLMAIFKTGSRNGHAVAALRVIDDSSARSRIAVYDSNYPGNTQRFIEVDRVNNTWSYPGYTSVPGVNTLIPIPLSAPLLPQTCPLAGRADAIGSATASQWQVLMDGEGDITNLPATETQIPVVSETQSDDSPEPIHMLPAGHDYVMNIDGTKLTQLSPSSFYFHRAGLSIRVEDIFLDPGQVDTVRIGADGASLAYIGSDEEFPVIRFGATFETVDYEIVVTPNGAPGGAETQVVNHIDMSAGAHSLEIRHKLSDLSPSFIHLGLRRRTATGDFEFENASPIAIGPSECLHLNYGDWKASGQDLQLVRDPGCDGHAPLTIALPDDG